MKKSIFAIMVIAAGVVAVVCSCNKERTELLNGNTTQTKAAPNQEIEQPVTPKYRFRLSALNPETPCNASHGHLCGLNIDVILNGDEVCWVKRQFDDPYGHLKFYFLTDNLYKNGAGELVDSAKNGAVTFDADCEILNKELEELIGTDLIPAGRYPANLTTYKGESAVCVHLNAIF